MQISTPRGVLPLDDRTPSQLSRELRRGAGAHLGDRRAVVVGSMIALGCMGLITLYQTGVIRHLPEPRVRGLDADKVDASDEAYQYLSVPDGTLGLVSYAITITLAAVGGRDRARRRPWLALALTAKVLVDAAQAARLTYDQWAKHRAFCTWCLVASGATFANVPFALREARSAARYLR